MAGKERDDETGISGKRKKSWREMDAQRGKSKYHSRQDDPGQQRIERSASYEKYKKAADALFGGGELPQGLAETFDPEGKRKAQKAALQKVQEAPDRKAWVERATAFLAEYPELPDDAYFLDSLLDHPKDRVVDKALAKLEALSRDGRLPREKAPKSLAQRLRTLEMTSMDPDVQQRAKALRATL
ncbi:MAG: hypothetical protein INH41_26480 [Myxococcaceae bacterium]|jgi:hypothetical protein|nr:hypothetical protein [Myxococcaceae bacterium]MCA3015946.1 hypothetical protein [Myxococcaceae bacterium]